MSLGFVGQALDAIVDGIVQSIQIAHGNMKKGTLSLGTGFLYDASINRSPSAYLHNPESERKKWVYRPIVHDIIKPVVWRTKNNID